MATICAIPMLPIRQMPGHKAEMISQLLFGESVFIMETIPKSDWVKVKCLWDNYEGWCIKNALVQVDDAHFVANQMAGNWVNTIKQNGVNMHLPFGAIIPSKKVVTIPGIEWNFEGIGLQNPIAFNEKDFLKIAHLFLHSSYLWGGRTVFGIDCSGYTQAVFKCFGIALQRDACLQAAQGTGIDFLQEATLGDLAFFDNKQGNITHVGILLNAQCIIHASGCVRIDGIDQQGIINSSTNKRTHALRIIKRYF